MSRYDHDDVPIEGSYVLGFVYDHEIKERIIREVPSVPDVRYHAVQRFVCPTTCVPIPCTETVKGVDFDHLR